MTDACSEIFTDCTRKAGIWPSICDEHIVYGQHRSVRLGAGLAVILLLTGQQSSLNAVQHQHYPFGTICPHCFVCWICGLVIASVHQIGLD